MSAILQRFTTNYFVDGDNSVRESLGHVTQKAKTLCGGSWWYTVVDELN